MTVRAVDGMAGVGKTALVVRVARAGRERYPDGCLFVDLHGYREDRGASGPQRVLRRLLRAVGADEGEDCGTWTSWPPPGGRPPPACGCSWCSTTRPAPNRCVRCCPPAPAACCW
ncbi:hypothetical protein O1L55_38460 [Streptomyces albulus]|nr:hypothetical protein [Streptomyces noursei]